ncbi:MAG: D-alanyl-D-alanine carboxypeptidase [Nocardiopsaceae bacterium]|jgi:D-alanyl-D-alanine carboxypeptidase (penicillin-binding protein 5/6)|nr:D-alanyl-D-alanine carboxypeptidase [Nocardiopsaceae bacterium]
MQTSRKSGRSHRRGRRRRSSRRIKANALATGATAVVAVIGATGAALTGPIGGGGPTPGEKIAAAAAINGAQPSKSSHDHSSDGKASGSDRHSPGSGDKRVLHPREVGGQRLGSSRVVVARNAPPLPPIPASAYVVANAKTGAVLAAKDAHGRYEPASTLKILTAITMLPRLDPGARIAASKLAASAVPNIIGVIPGHRYQVADLFRALLLISANDAAVTLVQASGSFSRGMALVNAEAHRLQAYDVVAKQPNGLPAQGQVVSAYDLALIARAALRMPAFMRYDQTMQAVFRGTRFGRVNMVNENGLLTGYRGALGGKTGWTMSAGATYVGMARRHGVTLIVSFLHAKPLTTITSAERLLDWGFAASGKVRQVGTLVRPLSNR